ncbi:hypothetical protein C9J60_39315 [Streptomyces sp. A244]|uniref:hypothetical protein n=1 Tax=Streptomyces sp. A244 TaxID=2137016 RepID=UPI000D1BB5E1|nr:hypothetical protein [Streptomyces sp. A244]PTH83153.1 hypothetical protein C9J60_39315 [Streptomyces sp. A244]
MNNPSAEVDLSNTVLAVASGATENRNRLWRVDLAHDVDWRWPSGATEDHNIGVGTPIDHDGRMAVAFRATEDRNMYSGVPNPTLRALAVALRCDRGSQRRPLGVTEQAAVPGDRPSR